jgi:hypothetical protein
VREDLARVLIGQPVDGRSRQPDRLPPGAGVTRTSRRAAADDDRAHEQCDFPLHS